MIAPQAASKQVRRPVVTLLSYAAGAVHEANQRALVASATRLGSFDRIEPRGVLSSRHPLRLAHPEVFQTSVGAGYWLWKPQIILEALEAAAADDIIVYIDVGARLRRPVSSLIALARERDGVLFANDYFNAAYTKRDAFVLTDTDMPDCHGARQLDAALMCLCAYSGRSAVPKGDLLQATLVQTGLWSGTKKYLKSEKLRQ